MKRLFFIAVFFPAAIGFAQPASKHSALLVVDMRIPARFHLVDQHVQQRLESLGFAVTMIDHEAPGSAADGMDLLVISSTVSGHTVAGKFTNCPAPVVTWEAYVLMHMHMTGKFQGVDYYCDHRDRPLEYVWMVNAPHPIAAGLPNGLFKPFKLPQPQSPATVAQVNWGRPLPSASIIATLPGEPTKAGVFAYEKGALMDCDFPAPARRVMLFLHSDGFDQLNDDGLKLFDAAILWAAASPKS